MFLLKVSIDIMAMHNYNDCCKKSERRSDIWNKLSLVLLAFGAECFISLYPTGSEANRWRGVLI